MSSCAMSSDGTRIATVSTQDSIRIWDAQSFQPAEDEAARHTRILGPNLTYESIPEDGWFRTADGGLLFWIPEMHRDKCLRHIGYGAVERPLRIRWEQLRHGENWTSIYDPQPEVP